MLHPTNIIHLLVLLGISWGLHKLNARRASRSQRSAFVLQMGVAVLCVDLIVGYSVIDRWYGSSISASWMTKSVIYNAILISGLLLLALRRPR